MVHGTKLVVVKFSSASVSAVASAQVLGLPLNVLFQKYAQKGYLMMRKVVVIRESGRRACVGTWALVKCALIRDGDSIG